MCSVVKHNLADVTATAFWQMTAPIWEVVVTGLANGFRPDGFLRSRYSHCHCRHVWPPGRRYFANSRECLEERICDLAGGAINAVWIQVGADRGERGGR